MAVGQGHEIVAGVGHGVGTACADMDLAAQAVPPALGTGHDTKLGNVLAVVPAKGAGQGVAQDVRFELCARFRGDHAKTRASAIRRVRAGMHPAQW